MKLIHHAIPPAAETHEQTLKCTQDPMYAQADAVTTAIRSAKYDGRFGTTAYGDLHPAIEEVLLELGYKIGYFDVPEFGPHFTIAWN